MVVLIMVYFVPLFNNNNNELGMAPPRLDTASWLQQISLNSWLPDYFNVWSSQSPVIHINQTKIIELRSWTSNDKRSFRRFKMTNNLGISVELCSLGATVTSFIVPDKQGKFNDVVLGFDNAPDYLDDANPYMGATVGRVGNRIARGQFSIDNVTYTLAQNNGNNHLHGGIVGFDAVNWQALVDHDSGSITFSYLSYDGEEGYPGDMLVFAKFTLSPISGALNIEYSATVSKKSPINIVNHMYFNLAGHSAGKQEMLQHTIQINAEYYTPVDAELIPTGEIESVSNTEFDLRVPTLLKEVVGKTRAGQMSGYDTNFVVWPTNMGNAGQNRFVARSVHEKSGRTLEVYSNQPGVQFYTGNFLPTWEESSLIGKHEAMYEQHGAFCLETQMYPDAINQQERFGLKAILSPGEIYYHNVIYSFGLL